MGLWTDYYRRIIWLLGVLRTVLYLAKYLPHILILVRPLQNSLLSTPAPSPHISKEIGAPSHWNTAVGGCLIVITLGCGMTASANLDEKGREGGTASQTSVCFGIWLASPDFLSLSKDGYYPTEKRKVHIQSVCFCKQHGLIKNAIANTNGPDV